MNVYQQEASSLLMTLKRRGILIRSVNDGVEEIAVGSCPAIDTIMSVDECWIRITLPGGHKATLFLIHGNGPGEIVADYSIPADADAAASLEAAMDSHSNKWEN